MVLMSVESQRVHKQSTYKVCNKNLECFLLNKKYIYSYLKCIVYDKLLKSRQYFRITLYYIIIIFWDHCRICDPSLTETSLMRRTPVLTLRALFKSRSCLHISQDTLDGSRLLSPCHCLHSPVTVISYPLCTFTLILSEVTNRNELSICKCFIVYRACIVSGWICEHSNLQHAAA